MHNKEVKIGLGESISRLLKLELTRINGLHRMPQDAIKERDMLFEALNEIKINLGFDCDGDGVPDTLEIFEQSASTSCCRISSLSEENQEKLETNNNVNKKSSRGRRRKSNKA